MTQKPRAILIDDSELTLEALKIYLGLRFEVVTASDGFSALREFEKPLDLIITDLLIPAVSGFGVISSLRQQHPLTPIIAMTGWGSPLLVGAIKADLVLIKPFELEELDQCIANLENPIDRPFSCCRASHEATGVVFVGSRTLK